MNASVRRTVEADEDVRAALNWFIDAAADRAHVEARIEAAQAFYRTHSQPRSNRVWPHTSGLVIKDDLIASYLAQADALLQDWRVYDLNLGAKIIPFIKDIGRGLEYLRDMPGAAARARRMLNPKNEHPDGALYELVTAVRYAHENFAVEFGAEGGERAGDLFLGVDEGPKLVQIECKRLRPSVYELREAALAGALFEPLAELVHARRLNIHVDVQFRTPLAHVPRSYLGERTEAALSSPLALPNGYPWQDDLATGIVRPARIDAVRNDMAETYLLFGPKLARLLAGRYVAEGTYHMAVSASAVDGDPRYMDELEYASVLTWHCLAPESIEARARHIGSKLADIDRQLANARVGFVHIGMDAERDPLTADRRRERNNSTVSGFRARSNLAEVHLHYYLPRISEQAAWMIDESVDSHTRHGEPLLDDRRLLILGSPDLENDLPVWQLPPPPVPDGSA